MWHVSVAKWASKIIYTDRWGEGVMRAAMRIAHETLSGVGIGETVLMVKPACIHLRRSLSDIEMAQLTQEWLAIPAQDEFSEDGLMESRL